MNLRDRVQEEALRGLIESIDQAEADGDDAAATMLRSVIPWTITEVIPGLIPYMTEAPDDTAVHMATVCADELCRILGVGLVSRDDETAPTVNAAAEAIIKVAEFKGMEGLTSEFTSALKAMTDRIEEARKDLWEPTIYVLSKLALTDKEKIEAFNVWSTLPGFVTMDEVRRGSVMFLMTRRLTKLADDNGVDL